ncbi:winged helix-turn-helix transcriptional regulator [Candidatus Acetothermia bacterium]|nr:winged helix-turn-helix transcriptional regulator [Candidatus Acetothermia bacterium]MBI3642550.1 winged helix-turn-helix transcriptional regulator [Candidatus Acetothermia bacterium]
MLLIRLDRTTSRIVLVIAGIALFIIVVFSIFHLVRFRENLASQFNSEASRAAQIFAESIHLDAPPQQITNITHQYVRGDILFAQVVEDGQMIAEDRVESAEDLTLTAINLSGNLFRKEGWLSDGHHYLDEARAITSGDGHLSYVRIGFSLREVDAEVLRETLIVIGWGAGILVLLAILLGAYLYRRSRWDDQKPIQESGFRQSADQDQHLQSENGNLIPIRWIEAGPLRIDGASKEVKLRQNHVDLSPKEYDLINLLASEPDRVFSNREILQRVWAGGYGATAKDVKQYIYLLRKKLEADPEKPGLIVTVRGFGYKLVSTQERGD